MLPLVLGRLAAWEGGSSICPRDQLAQGKDWGSPTLKTCRRAGATIRTVRRASKDKIRMSDDDHHTEARRPGTGRGGGRGPGGGAEAPGVPVIRPSCHGPPPEGPPSPLPRRGVRRALSTKLRTTKYWYLARRSGGRNRRNIVSSITTPAGAAIPPYPSQGRGAKSCRKPDKTLFRFHWNLPKVFGQSVRISK